jgi:hypothetical protein
MNQDYYVISPHEDEGCCVEHCENENELRKALGSLRESWWVKDCGRRMELVCNLDEIWSRRSRSVWPVLILCGAQTLHGAQVREILQNRS